MADDWAAAPLQPGEQIPSYRPKKPNAAPWIIASAVILAAVLIVGALLFINSQADRRADRATRCPKIQAAVRSLLIQGGTNVDRYLDLSEEWRDLGCEGDLIDLGF